MENGWIAIIEVSIGILLTFYVPFWIEYKDHKKWEKQNKK